MKQEKDTKEIRWMKQQIRRKMLQKAKPSAKTYNRKQTEKF